MNRVWVSNGLGPLEEPVSLPVARAGIEQLEMLLVRHPSQGDQTLGYADVYPAFLRHAENAGHGVRRGHPRPARRRPGDMRVDIAFDLLRDREPAAV